MSHVATVQTEIRDLDALKAAAEELGAEFIAGQKTYRWFGRFVGDSPLPPGMTVEDLGKCDHVVRVPGVAYEIGVVKRGDHYTLAYDFWGSGQGLLDKFGPNVQKLTQMYGVHKATMEARRKGFSVQRSVLDTGQIRLTIGGVR